MGTHRTTVVTVSSEKGQYTNTFQPPAPGSSANMWSAFFREIRKAINHAQALDEHSGR